jgi:hypothetical protein
VGFTEEDDLHCYPLTVDYVARHTCRIQADFLVIAIDVPPRFDAFILPVIGLGHGAAFQLEQLHRGHNVIEVGAGSLC